jgi:hypothetical protein
LVLGLEGDVARGYVIAYNGMDTGLGNRIRVILSTQILAELEGRRFAYVWPTGAGFGPRFDQLYQGKIGTVVPRSVSRVLAKHWRYVDESLSWLDDRKREERIWQIRTGAPLNLPADAPTWGERLRELNPVPQIAARVREIYDRQLRGRPYIGVMIRSHAVSHGETQRASPVEWFLGRLHAVRQEIPSATFFLSCDTPETQARVIAELGNCVAQEDKGGYNTLEGVRSAVADLYLLASSQHLIAPHFSSFIHMAQHLNGDVVPIETSRTATPDRVLLESSGTPEDPIRPWVRTTTGGR